MKSGNRQKTALSSVVVFFFFASAGPVATEKVPDYTEIKAAVDIAYQARSDLLYKSTGIAEMFFQEPVMAEDDFDEYLHMAYEFTGFDSNDFTSFRYAQRTTTWYKKGQMKRFDTFCPDTNDPKAIITKCNRCTVSDANSSIIYDLAGSKVYKIPRPLTVYGNITNQSISFDVHKLYKFNGITVHELLYNWFEKETSSKRTQQITKEIFDQTECIRVGCIITEINTAGQEGQQWHLELWLAPQMAYSLVKAELWMNRPPNRDNILMESYEATYEKSQSNPEIWLLKTLVWIKPTSTLSIFDSAGYDVLKVAFKDTKIGIDIPDAIFTPEGLAIPDGMTIEDTRGPVFDDLFDVQNKYSD